MELESKHSYSQTPESVLHIRSIIAKSNKKLNDGVAYEQVLNYIFDSLESVIPFERIGIALLEDEDSRVVLRWMQTKLKNTNLSYGYSAPLEGSSLENLLLSKKPRIINDLPRYLELHPDSLSAKIALSDGIRSSLTFAIKANGLPVGFVFFSSSALNTYQAVHIDHFMEVVEGISLFVQYGKLRQFFEMNTSTVKSLRTTVHDLRSPLCVIEGFIEMMTLEPWYQELDKKSRDIFGILQRNTQFMMDLVSNLAVINKSKSSKGEINRVKVFLPIFFSDFNRCGKILTAKKKIIFEVKLQDFLPEEWLFDPIQIRQVIDNLLTNAIKFSNQNSQVKVFVSHEVNRLIFAIKDSGQGIPKKDHSKLFLDFGKTRILPTAGESSTGLGLAIARRIVQAHGGDIEIDSEVNKGSTFTFWLPRGELPM